MKVGAGFLGLFTCKTFVLIYGSLKSISLMSLRINELATPKELQTVLEGMDVEALSNLKGLSIPLGPGCFQGLAPKDYCNNSTDISEQPHTKLLMECTSYSGKPLILPVMLARHTLGSYYLWLHSCKFGSTISIGDIHCLYRGASTDYSSRSTAHKNVMEGKCQLQWEAPMVPDRNGDLLNNPITPGQINQFVVPRFKFYKLTQRAVVWSEESQSIIPARMKDTVSCYTPYAFPERSLNV